MARTPTGKKKKRNESAASAESVYMESGLPPSKKTRRDVEEEKEGGDESTRLPHPKRPVTRPVTEQHSQIVPTTHEELDELLRDEEWLFEKLTGPNESIWDGLAAVGFVYSNGYRNPLITDFRTNRVIVFENYCDMRANLIAYGVPQIETLDVEVRMGVELWVRRREVLSWDLHANARTLLTRFGYTYDFIKIEADDVVECLVKCYAGDEKVDLIHDGKAISLGGRSRRGRNRRGALAGVTRELKLGEVRDLLRAHPEYFTANAVEDPNTQLAFEMWIASSPSPIPKFRMPPPTTDAQTPSSGKKRTKTAAAISATPIKDDEEKFNVSEAKAILAPASAVSATTVEIVDETTPTLKRKPADIVKPQPVVKMPDTVGNEIVKDEATAKPLSVTKPTVPASKPIAVAKLTVSASAQNPSMTNKNDSKATIRGPTTIASTGNAKKSVPLSTKVSAPAASVVIAEIQNDKKKAATSATAASIQQAPIIDVKSESSKSSMQLKQDNKSIASKDAPGVPPSQTQQPIPKKGSPQKAPGQDLQNKAVVQAPEKYSTSKLSTSTQPMECSSVDSAKPFPQEGELPKNRATMTPVAVRKTSEDKNMGNRSAPTSNSKAKENKPTSTAEMVSDDRSTAIRGAPTLTSKVKEDAPISTSRVPAVPTPGYVLTAQQAHPVASAQISSKPETDQQAKKRMSSSIHHEQNLSASKKIKQASVPPTPERKMLDVVQDHSKTSTAEKKKGKKKSPKRSDSSPYSKPKKGISAYNYFYKEEYERIMKGVYGNDPSKIPGNDPRLKDYISAEVLASLKNEEGKILGQEMTKLVSQRWKIVSSEQPAQLAIYTNRAKQDSERYNKEMQSYKALQSLHEATQGMPLPSTSAVRKAEKQGLHEASPAPQSTAELPKEPALTEKTPDIITQGSKPTTSVATKAEVQVLHDATLASRSTTKKPNPDIIKQEMPKSATLAETKTELIFSETPKVPVQRNSDNITQRVPKSTLSTATKKETPATFNEPASSAMTSGIVISAVSQASAQGAQSSVQKDPTSSDEKTFKEETGQANTVGKGQTGNGESNAAAPTDVNVTLANTSNQGYHQAARDTQDATKPVNVVQRKGSDSSSEEAGGQTFENSRNMEVEETEVVNEAQEHARNVREPAVSMQGIEDNAGEKELGTATAEGGAGEEREELEELEDHENVSIFQKLKNMFWSKLF